MMEKVSITAIEEIFNAIQEKHGEKDKKINQMIQDALAADRNGQIDFIVKYLQDNPEEYINVLFIIFNTSYKQTFMNNVKGNTPLTEKISKIESIKKKIVENPNSETDKQALSVEKDDFYFCISSLVAAFIGDALGSYAEFSKRNATNYLKILEDPHRLFGDEKGQITDDSEMALSLCYALMDGKSIKIPEQHTIYFYYALWFLSNPLDIGNTTKNALYHASNLLKNKQLLLTNESMFTSVKEKIKLSSTNSLSNGFLMRISPLAIWFFYMEKDYITATFKTKTAEEFRVLYEKILEFSKKDTITTHCETEAIHVGAMYIFMLLNCMMGYSYLVIFENMRLLLDNDTFLNSTDDGEISMAQNFLINMDRIDATMDWCPWDHYDFKHLDDNMGYYVHAIRLCLFYIKHVEGIKEAMTPEKAYRKIIDDICNLGGDTDTNCCIVGAVIGPLLGLENLGSEMNLVMEYFSSARFLYAAVFGIYYVWFLEKKTRSMKEIGDDSQSNGMYPYNSLRIILSMLTVENYTMS